MNIDAIDTLKLTSRASSNKPACSRVPPRESRSTHASQLAIISGPGLSGGMAEWLKAAVLKTAGRKPRGFESYSLRQLIFPLASVSVRCLVLVGGKSRPGGNRWRARDRSV